QVDEGDLTRASPHDVRRLHVAVQKPRSMYYRQLLRSAHQNIERAAHVFVRPLHQLVEAHAVDQLAHHVWTPGTRQSPEAEHSWHAQSLQTRERHCLANQRIDLGLTGVLGEKLQRVFEPGAAVTHRPHLAAPPLTEQGERLVPLGQLELGQCSETVVGTKTEEEPAGTEAQVEARHELRVGF